MTTLQEIALEVYGSSDFSDALHEENYAYIAEICVAIAKEIIKTTDEIEKRTQPN